MKSVWKETNIKKFDKLSKDIKTDVLIIGGGLAGILTAYFLHQNGVDYVLVEKDRICSKNTGNTTAKITTQHGLIYDKIITNRGLEIAKKYYNANDLALKKYNEMSKTIDCDFEIKDNYVYSINNLKKLEKEMLTLDKMGVKAEFCKNLSIPIETVGAIKFSNQAQFNVLKFVSNIALNLNIYENTFVKEIKDNTAFTDKFKIRANKIVCATHFPFINKHGLYFLKLYQHRSYVLALENAKKIDGMFVDENDKGLSFRNYNGLLLLGGGGNRTGKKNGNWDELRSFAKKHYPNSNVKYFWSAQDCMSVDSIPYIGKYSDNTPNLFVITGFNKWGMTSSMISAMIISNMILEKQNDYIDVFNPSRSFLYPQLFINGFESAVNLATPFKKRCSHLGCALKWNDAEHSWDCPCHGSRFDEKGKVLDNPANKNI